MSITNWLHDATPEEAAAYKLGKNESRIQLAQMARQLVEYELALTRIKKATDVRTTFEIAATVLTRNKGGAS